MSATPPNALPIYQVADHILAGLATHGRVVLSAPTGSGKSTQVPQILLDRAGIVGEIVVLQPRRLAARLLAKRVAEERGSRLGDEVGYQIRFENVTGPQTRIRFVTEAILLRQILQDPTLRSVGAIVFDEFHERHLTSDLSLASALDTVRCSRSDLKLVVMSATLDIEVLETYLQPCARVEASGRMYPVAIQYMGAALNRDAAPVWERAAAAFRQAAREGIAGDVLIFMAGAYEIGKTMQAIESQPAARNYTVLPLHGSLSPEAQDRAVGTGRSPKVIVATNVAETSITIDGVGLVIDGGQARVARYDPRRGINSLLVEPISRASAEQRSGRAGRTGPGTCLRLWSEAEHVARAERDVPEVKRVDLSETVLLLAAAGIDQPENFAWFEAPTPKALSQASNLLRDLGALDGAGALTKMGRKMARFPLHPRYARMLLEADVRGVLPDVALIAAMSQGRPLYRVAREAHIRKAQLQLIEDHVDERSDFFVQLRAWDLAREAKFNPSTCAGLGIHGVAARQVGDTLRQLLQLAERQGLQAGRVAERSDQAELICKCLLAGFSDHLAKRNDRGTLRCRMVHGRSGELRRESVVATELFVAAEIEERELRREVTVMLGMATAIESKWLEELFPADWVMGSFTAYDPALRRVVCRSERRFRDLVLQSSDQGEPDYNKAAELLAAEVAAGNLNLKNWDASVESWILRVNFVAEHCPETEISPIDAEGRQLLMEQICHAALSYKEIKDRPVMATVKEWISPEQHYYVDQYAPAEMTLPRRLRPVKLRYEADGRAFIASKLQDFYDVPSGILKVANGKVPLLIELLAPNQRPAHLTDDLDGFWAGAYQHVRKDLAGRYPKHEWR
ncbi:MAG: ATP-dependent helicase HrpB [Lentimonas sp.]|jgi:ATP-dependent helicase HrpB